MSNFTLRKMSPTGNDMKSTTQGTTLRQQGFHEVNKRRNFLQDNSWIKNRPEEEKDENYGRVVLSRHNSHDALDRKANERDEPKATISRYRSDDTLDRISDRNDATNTYKANTLDNRLTNRNTSTFRSPEAAKTQTGGSFSGNTTNPPAPASATTPVKKKRQSWFPPPPPGYSATPSMGASRREPTVRPPIPPKPVSPVSSPNQQRRENRQICPSKPGVYTEANRSAERNISEELDNIIKMNKSLNRNQGLDGLFRANPKADQTEKRAKSLENLIFTSARTDKDDKGNQGLGSLIKVNQRTEKNEKGRQDLQMIIQVNARTDKTRRGGKDLDNVIKVNPKGRENATGKQDFNGFIKANPETNKNIKRGQSLDNLINVTPEVNRSNAGSKDLDNLIKVVPRTGKSMQGGHSLDSLIKVAPETNRTNQRIQLIPSAYTSSKASLDELINVGPKAVKNMTGNRDLDKLIRVSPETLTNNQRNQDLDNLIKVSPAVTRSSQSEGLDSLIKVKSSGLKNTERDQDLKNLIEVNSNVSENKNGSSNAETRHAGPKDTVVYTRTYVENSKLLKDGYQENISGKYIQTVYSTSDRSVIEREMCTYCRQPLGTDTKMILDELQICCHSTCFKCEICKQPLENLQAGDSIWIYRQTIHCEPCYSKVMAKWIQ
uniref:Sciellin n=1 Tax=Panthera leo TaxID=9689 RepID=A0A8C8WI83_PANLE